MSTGPAPKPRRVSPEETIRRRCAANPDAAEYTLYVRSLVEEHLGGRGGYAKVLRIAERRGILPHAFTRKTLSEQLCGRYPNGPKWSTTEMIIACLPDTCDDAGIRAVAAGWYQCANRQRPEGYDGPVSRPPGKPGLENVPESKPTVPYLQQKIARLQQRHVTETTGIMNTLKEEQQARRREQRRADEMEAAYHQMREELLSLKAAAVETATIHEEYARQSVVLELLAASGLRTRPILDLPPLAHTRKRVRLGHLVEAITAQAPPERRALARYLCVYTELAALTPAELAARTNIKPTLIQDILAARQVPDDQQLASLIDVLRTDSDTPRHLAAQARPASPLDESFWQLTLGLAEISSDDAAGSMDVVGPAAGHLTKEPDNTPTTPQGPEPVVGSTASYSTKEPDNTPTHREAYYRQPAVIVLASTVMVLLVTLVFVLLGR